jgi:hypothetical protein
MAKCRQRRLSIAPFAMGSNISSFSRSREDIRKFSSLCTHCGVIPSTMYPHISIDNGSADDALVIVFSNVSQGSKLFDSDLCRYTLMYIFQSILNQKTHNPTIKLRKATPNVHDILTTPALVLSFIENGANEGILT